MSRSLSAPAPQVIRSYYHVLLGGEEAYGRGDSLRPLLSEHLDFTGSLAGHHPDATEGFLQGASGFVSTVISVDFVREIHNAEGSAVLYDATMPGGVVRLAEFFTYQDGVIGTLDLHYDGNEYIAKGGR
jgi:hypothetical protein